MDLNSEGPYSSSEREIKFRRCLFTYYIKDEIRYSHVVDVQKRAKKCTKSVMHVQSCCFPSASLDLKVPIVINDAIKPAVKPPYYSFKIFPQF